MAAPQLVILTTRPGRKGRDYDTIWNRERNEGPLKTITRGQAEELAAQLRDGPATASQSTGPCATASPRYATRIQALLDEGCDRILLVPLYPQYAAATSATACDQAFRALMEMRWQPSVRVVAALSRRPGLYRRARGLDAAVAREAARSSRR